MSFARRLTCSLVAVLLLPIHFAGAQGQEAREYADYLGGYENAVWVEEAVTLLAAEGEGAHQASLDGREAVVFEQLGDTADWVFEAPQTGLYSVALAYQPLPGHGRDIEFTLTVDGKTPYTQLESCVMPRVFRDATPILRDNRDNDIRPQKEEAVTWRAYDLRDADGMNNGLLLVYLTKGEHRLRVMAKGEPFALSSVTLGGAEAHAPYEKALAAWMEGHADLRGQTPKSVTISAELTKEVSSQVLYPIADRSGPDTESQGEANHPSKIRLNTIGGANWKFAGQWISWSFTIEEPGFYKIAFKARQNASRGMISTREIRIDGAVPYREMAFMEFPYSVDWCNVVSSLVYLDAGGHELAMEVVPGGVAELLRTAEDTVLELNTLYRKIIMVTGTNPDPYQDYFLERKVPGLLDSFTQIAQRLHAQVSDMEALTGVEGSEASLLEEIAIQLESMVEKPDTIQVRLDNFKGNIGSLGTWILRLREQPLELDRITFLAENEAPKSPQANFFAKTYFDVAGVALSFFEDYSSIGNVYSDRDALTIWISQQDLQQSGASSGRDQALIIKRLIDDSFTAETGIPVNLNLVDSAQTLQRAVMGRKGPDIALTLPKTTPINLAMRGALYDLTQFADYDEVVERFYASALVPYRYLGGVYALAETQAFNMLFYRTDIFEELELTPPDTWEEFYQVMKTLQKNNLQVGIPESQDIFEMFLFQKGGQFYQDDLRATAFDKPEALEAFTEWTGLYANHGLPLSFDFYNRFRTGEMPIGITGYTFYNTLAVAAPELRNLWRMIPVPGTRDASDALNRMESAYGTAAVILSDAKNKDDAWEFLKWWTRGDVQARFGLELEYLIGPAARYNTANKEAFESLPWSQDERQNLKAQWRQVWDVPQLPGNYFTNRNIQFAFRRVVYYYENERETLFKYNEEINKEIARKREEFGLE